MRKNFTPGQRLVVVGGNYHYVPLGTVVEYVSVAAVDSDCAFVVWRSGYRASYDVHQVIDFNDLEPLDSTPPGDVE